MNHPTMGRIPAGGRVERSLAFDFNRLSPVSLLLREPDFSTAGEISDAINREFGHAVASARDGGRVEVDPSATGVANLTAVLGENREPYRKRASARSGRGQRTYGDDRDGERRAPRRGVHPAWRILGADFDRVFRFPAGAAVAGEDRSGAADRSAGQGQSRRSVWKSAKVPASTSWSADCRTWERRRAT